MRRNDGNAVWSAFVLEPSLQNYVNSNSCRYGHRTLAPLRQFLSQIRRSSMQHSNLPCHCLTLKKRSYHIIAAGYDHELSSTQQTHILPCHQRLSLKFSVRSGSKKRSRSHPSGCSVPEVRKSKVFQAVRPVNFPKLKKAKVFQTVQLGNFPACQPLQLRLRSISSIA